MLRVEQQTPFLALHHSLTTAPRVIQAIAKASPLRGKITRSTG